eukprot:4009494-Pyramimonas_sp.AAC.1
MVLWCAARRRAAAATRSSVRDCARLRRARRCHAGSARPRLGGPAPAGPASGPGGGPRERARPAAGRPSADRAGLGRGPARVAAAPE